MGCSTSKDGFDPNKIPPGWEQTRTVAQNVSTGLPIDVVTTNGMRRTETSSSRSGQVPQVPLIPSATYKPRPTTTTTTTETETKAKPKTTSTPRNSIPSSTEFTITPKRQQRQPAAGAALPQPPQMHLSPPTTGVSPTNPRSTGVSLSYLFVLL